MAKVFLSYDRDDTEQARRVALALERAGHSVWWDLHIRGGEQYTKVIDEALKAADAVVVLWSNFSVESAWVRDEAAAGRDSGRLVPVSLDDADPPLGFRQFQTIDLRGWKGRGKPAQLRTLFAAIDALAASGKNSVQPPPFAEAPRPVSAARSRARFLVPALIALAVLLSALFYWLNGGQSAGPATVAVAAADRAPLSQQLARDLLVKLGSLQGNRIHSVELVDEQSASFKANLRFVVSAAGDADHPSASVTLISNKEGTVRAPCCGQRTLARPALHAPISRSKSPFRRRGCSGARSKRPPVKTVA
jgi:hypothetical protein